MEDSDRSVADRSDEAPGVRRHTRRQITTAVTRLLPFILLLLAGASCSVPQAENTGSTGSPLKGLRSTGYVVSDLAAAKSWYTDFLGVEPYFDEPFYAGFDIGGYELGLSPAEEGWDPGTGGLKVLWRVENIEDVTSRAVKSGAVVADSIQDVGGGMLVATVIDPFGNYLGFIQEGSQP